MIRNTTGWASSWTNPLSPGPPRGEFPTGEATQGELQGELLQVSHVTHQNLIGYISAISKLIHFWFSPKFSAAQGLQS